MSSGRTITTRTIPADARASIARELSRYYAELCDADDKPAPAFSLARVIDAMSGGRADWLPGYHVRLLDGNHLPGSEHRLKELRTIGAGALPGRSESTFVRNVWNPEPSDATPFGSSRTTTMNSAPWK